MDGVKERIGLYIAEDGSNSDKDVREILHAIGDDYVKNLVWGISWLDWLGEPNKNLPDQVANARHGRILVRGVCLLEQIEKVYQVLEGHFRGFSSEKTALAWLEQDSDDFVPEIELKVDRGYLLYLPFQTLADNIAKVFAEVHTLNSTSQSV